MILDLKKLSGTSLLAGSSRGKKMFSSLLAATIQEPLEPSPVFLDFARIEVATASFLRESVFAFRNLVRNRKSHFYPVVANINPDIRDELVELVSGKKSDAIVACRLSESGKVTAVELIGNLEPVQRRTLECVRQTGETDASHLMKSFGAADETTRTTAWNNRLAALSSLGLLIEISEGRAKKYKPVLEGI